MAVSVVLSPSTIVVSAGVTITVTSARPTITVPDAVSESPLVRSVAVTAMVAEPYPAGVSVSMLLPPGMSAPTIMSALDVTWKTASTSAPNGSNSMPASNDTVSPPLTKSSSTWASNTL